MALGYVPLFSSLIAVFLVSRLRWAVNLRRCLTLPSRRDCLLAGGATVLLSLLLAVFRLWPWTWQWPPRAAVNVAAALIAGGQLLGFAIWGAALVIVTPVLEEAVVRFGLLETFKSLTGSSAAGIGGSSLIFAIAHLGGKWRPDEGHLNNASWLFFASLFVAVLTERRGGKLGFAIAVHAARNLAEFAVLLLSVSVL